MVGNAGTPARHKPEGFTLIELLVVIAIIAILMGILMPALKKAKNQAQSSACQGNLKNFTLAVTMYAQDHDDLFCHPGSCYFSQINSFPGEVPQRRFGRPDGRKRQRRIRGRPRRAPSDGRIIPAGLALLAVSGLNNL